MKKSILTALLVLLMAFAGGCGVLMDSLSSDDSGDSSGDDSAEQEQASEDIQRELSQAREDAEQAREEAEAAIEEAEDSQEQSDSSPSSDPPQGSDVRSPSETQELQYDYLNSGQYEEAYQFFAEESQGLVSISEYSSAFSPTYEVSDYSVTSEQIDGYTATVEADLVVSGTQQGTQQYPITQEFVWEDDEWQVIMRDAQIEAILGSGDDSEDTWTGGITEIDENGDIAGEYEAVVDLISIDEMDESMVGDVVGEVSYSLGCSGVWVLEEVDAYSVVVEEQIQEGSDNCVGFILHTLTPLDDGELDYYYENDENGNIGTGTLTR